MNRIKYIKKNRIQERMKDKEGDEWIANQNLSAVELLTNSLRYTWRTEEKSLYWINFNSGISSQGGGGSLITR